MERNRRSVRIKDYDYSQAGAYFITICTYNRECIFGDISDGEMMLNGLGEIVNEEWMRTAILRVWENVEIDTYITMPNHVHGIVVINHGRGVLQYAPTGTLRSPSQTIGAIIRGFKSASTKRINQSRNTLGNPVWQRNYYEHVIRNDDDLTQIREYVAQNPLQWDLDENNPQNNDDTSHRRKPL